jgi:cell division protein FtsZ
MVKEGLINLDFADVRTVMREMGKAMMGTGEAEGDKRALTAAEAAIANPLIDDASMKGAKGLLISITGGRDLTLYEVDEAATRIREEVDQDANIIVGATFDEGLDGIIRVSVVATGIDRAMNEVHERNMEFRSAPKPAVRPSAAVAPAAAAAQPAYVAQAPKAVDPIAQTIRQAEVEMERELDIVMRHPAPVQQPVAQEEAFRPQSRLFSGAQENAPVMRQPAPQAPQPAPVMQQPIVQPTMSQQPAGQPQMRHEPIIRQAPEQVRMPKVEDFSPVVKAEMDHRAQPAAAPAEDRGPMGLLKRITNSLGRREEETVAADMTTTAPSAASQQRRPLSPEASLYAPRRGQLDDHGRAAPQARMSQEDDQLEIPAFLRRQSN